jgi:hypothetical protein
MSRTRERRYDPADALLCERRQMAIATLGYSDYLEAHGVPRDQAKAQATAAYQYLFPQLVTQPDLKLAVSELKRDMAELKSDLTMRVFVIVGLLDAVLFALMKLT